MNSGIVRLAIEQTYQGHGLGRALFRDAGQHVLQAADIIGIRGIIVHALSPEAKAFYLALGQAWNLMSGMTGYVSFAHGALAGIGSYATVMAINAWNRLGAAYQFTPPAIANSTAAAAS